MEGHVSNAGDTSSIQVWEDLPGEGMATHSCILAESGASQSSVQEQNQEDICIKRFIRKAAHLLQGKSESEGQAGILEYRVKLLP